MRRNLTVRQDVLHWTARVHPARPDAAPRSCAAHGVRCVALEMRCSQRRRTWDIWLSYLHTPASTSEIDYVISTPWKTLQDRNNVRKICAWYIATATVVVVFLQYTKKFSCCRQAARRPASLKVLLSFNNCVPLKYWVIQDNWMAPFDWWCTVSYSWFRLVTCTVCKI